MDDCNYSRHLKALGKFVFSSDDAASKQADMNHTIAETVDQVATGNANSLPGSTLVAATLPNRQAAVAAGPERVLTLMRRLVTDYLVGDNFVADLHNQPSGARTVKKVLDAFILDMVCNSKTFTTVGATGFVHFFVALAAPDGTFPQSDSPTYADGDYVKQDHA